MPARPRVLLDCTAMQDVSGHRGIGRMLLDLLAGLHATRSHWSSALELTALLDLRWGPHARISDDLAAAVNLLQEIRGRGFRTVRLRRRLWLDIVANHARADLVHLPEAIGVPLSSRVPRSVTCHDLIPLRLAPEYLSAVGRFTRMPRELRRFRTARRVVAISPKTRDELLELLHVPADRIDVVPNGIDLDRWRGEPLAADASRLRALGVGGKPFIVYVGGCDPRKDVPALLRCVEVARRSVDLDLVWAGRIPDKDMRELRAVLRSRSLESELDRAILCGFVSDDDLALLYRHALAHVFLSRLEGFGLSVAEAMAAGCPVIVARNSGSDQVAGDAGFVVAPGDAQAAAEAVLMLAADPSSRTDRAARGARRVTQFDRSQMALGYVESWLRACRARA